MYRGGDADFLLKLFDEPQKAFVSFAQNIELARESINERLERKKYNLSKWIQACVLKGTPEVDVTHII